MKLFCFFSALFLSTICLLAAELSCGVFPVCRDVEFRVVPESAAEQRLFERISVLFNSPDGKRQDGTFSPIDEMEKLPVKRLNDGSLLCRVKLHLPGRYHVRLMIRDGRKVRPYGSKLAIFGLPDELLKLRPYKGDLHVHLVVGEDKISPRAMLGLTRRLGCDFVAVADRLNWSNSETVRCFAENNRLGITVIHGEELFIGDGGATVVALGVPHGLSGFLESYSSDLPRAGDVKQSPVERDAVKLADLIREKGGVSLYAHPYRRKNWRYEVPTDVSERLLTNGVFDAVELVNDASGYNCVVDTMARLWQIERKCGRKFSAVGVGDTLNPSIRYYGVQNTILFAAGNDEKSLLEALKSGYCVTALGVVRRLMFLGDPLLVEYSRFLEDFYWPKHDSWARRQSGRILLLQGVPGDKQELAIISDVQKSIDDFRNRFFYGSGSCGHRIDKK